MEFTSDKMLKQLQRQLNLIKKYGQDKEMKRFCEDRFFYCKDFAEAVTGRTVEVKNWEVRWQ